MKDELITTEECRTIIETFQNNKSRGNDGIPTDLISEPFIDCFNENRRAFCLHMHQYGPLNEVPQMRFLWTVYVHYQHLHAVFWSWMTYIGCYAPQTCSLRYQGIFTMKVNLLQPRCRPWEDSLSFRKTVHRRQDGGWMFLPPNISRTFFEQEEKVSMIVFR